MKWNILYWKMYFKDYLSALTSISFYKLKVTDSKQGLISKKLWLQAPCQIWKPPVHRERCLILLTSWTFTGISVVFYSIRNKNLKILLWAEVDKVTPIHYTWIFSVFLSQFSKSFSLHTVYLNVSVSSITEALNHPLYCLPFSSVPWLISVNQCRDNEL